MATKIKSDTLQALADWNAGKPVKSLELGHAHRMKASSEPTAAPQIDMSKHIHRDQERAHAFCFALIEHFDAPPDDYAEFLAVSREIAGQWNDLIDEERVGAESLAWKALRVGWGKAIAGHEPHDYIEVTNPAVQASAT
jgi:hypothetical protein